MGAFSPDVIPEEIVLRHCFYEAFYRFHHFSSRILPECFCRRQPEYSKSRISVHNLEYAERFHPQSRTSLPRSRTLETAPKLFIMKTPKRINKISSFHHVLDASTIPNVSALAFERGVFHNSKRPQLWKWLQISQFPALETRHLSSKRDVIVSKS